jgi:predicted transcriptional regulator
MQCDARTGELEMSVKHRITVNLDDAEYQALQLIAEGSERSLAWLGRKAICDLIDQHERSEAPLLAGLNAGGPFSRQSAQ